MRKQIRALSADAGDLTMVLSSSTEPRHRNIREGLVEVMRCWWLVKASGRRNLVFARSYLVQGLQVNGRLSSHDTAFHGR
jgi:hypothetical protein